MIIRREKKNDEEWKKFSFRSVNEGIDCGDRQCFLEYRVLPDCDLILETNNTACIIPCVMDGCERELHHFIPCPLWNCEAKSTTSSTSTPSTTSSTSTPSTTNPSSTTTSYNPNKPSEMSALIYTSIVLNIFFVAILLAVVIVKCRIQISTTLANFRARRSATVDPAPAQTNTRENPDPNEHFSVGSNSDDESEIGLAGHNDERQPLVAPKSKPIASHGSLEQGHDNLAFISPPAVSHSLENIRRAILGGDTIPNVSNLSIPSSSTNWQDVSLASSTSDTLLENTSASLNKVESEPKKETKPIFMLMKTFRKK